jgi:hypothetical protein
MFDALKKIFENKITIEISSELFVFKSLKSSKSIKPYFFVQNDSKKIILTAGEDYIGPLSATKVIVFPSTDLDSLAQLLRHGCSQVLQGIMLFVRPTIILAPALGTTIDSEQRKMLTAAAFLSGAIIVRFADECVT